MSIPLKNKKSNWHIENTPKMAELYNNTCQNCKQKADMKNGVIHHTQYTGNDYIKTLEKLLSDTAIKWLCKTCHKIEHIALKKEEVSYRMKHSGFCALCDEFTWRAWFTLMNGHRSQGFPICKKCTKYLFKREILIEIEEERSERIHKHIKWNEKDKIPRNSKAIFKVLRKKIFRESYGNLDNFSKKESSQISLF